MVFGATCHSNCCPFTACVRFRPHTTLHKRHWICVSIWTNEPILLLLYCRLFSPPSLLWTVGPAAPCWSAFEQQLAARYTTQYKKANKDHSHALLNVPFTNMIHIRMPINATNINVIIIIFYWRQLLQNVIFSFIFSSFLVFILKIDKYQYYKWSSFKGIQSWEFYTEETSSNIKVDKITVEERCFHFILFWKRNVLV